MLRRDFLTITGLATVGLLSPSAFADGPTNEPKPVAGTIFEHFRFVAVGPRVRQTIKVATYRLIKAENSSWFGVELVAETWDYVFPDHRLVDRTEIVLPDGRLWSIKALNLKTTPTHDGRSQEPSSNGEIWLRDGDYLKLTYCLTGNAPADFLGIELYNTHREMNLVMNSPSFPTVNKPTRSRPKGKYEATAN